MDSLGNLQEWSEVLDKLEKMQKEQVLDRNQEGLLRVLRFQGNWRLRERGLEYAAGLKEPMGELTAQVCRILGDETVFLDLRVLAAVSLGSIASKQTGHNRAAAVAALRDIIATPQAPLLTRAAEQALQQIEQH